MENVIVPYGQKVDTSLGEVIYNRQGLMFLERVIVSSENLSGVSRRLLMGQGQEVEVHYLSEHDNYEGPVALLFIRGVMGIG